MFQALQVDKALDVIALMRAGLSQKDALAEKGMDDRAFSNIIAKNPMIIEEIQTLQRERIANLANQIIADQELNMRALSSRSETLRLQLESGIFEKEATRELIAIDKHQQKTLGLLYPSLKTENTPPPPPQDADKARANEILAGMKGAKLQSVTVKETVVTFGAGEKEDTSDVVEGNFSIPALENGPEDSDQGSG